jgi:hypothetical protein
MTRTFQGTAQLLGTLARPLAASRSLDATLSAIVDSAATTLGPAATVGVSYLDGRQQIVARAQSDTLVTVVDDLQSALQQGPCHHVLTGGANVVRASTISEAMSVGQISRPARWSAACWACWPSGCSSTTPRSEQQFNQAVRNRDVIGQAKGVLMSRYDLDEETAFATLVRYSQAEHVKLYDVAKQLLESFRAERGAGTAKSD